MNTAEKILVSTLRSIDLGAKSNKEIANLLLEKVWSKFDMLSMESDIIEEAIERLKNERESI